MVCSNSIGLTCIFSCLDSKKTIFIISSLAHLNHPLSNIVLVLNNINFTDVLNDSQNKLEMKGVFLSINNSIVKYSEENCILIKYKLAF